MWFGDKSFPAAVGRDEHLRRRTDISIEAKSAPSLQFSGHPAGLLMAIAVDLDAPYGSAPFLSPIVHWIQTGFKPDSASTLITETPVLVDWLPPSPPPFSAPHRYLVIIYRQPPSFDLPTWEAKWKKPVGIPARCRWKLDDFVKQADLSHVLASNYFCS